MKFWQFTSVLGDDDIQKAKEITTTKEQWGVFGQWLQNISRIVGEQDREKLDFVLPNDFVRECLKGCGIYLYISQENILRSRAIHFGDKKITVLDAFDRYGGEAIEEALEKGSFKV